MHMRIKSGDNRDGRNREREQANSQWQEGGGMMGRSEIDEKKRGNNKGTKWNRNKWWHKAWGVNTKLFPSKKENSLTEKKVKKCIEYKI